MLQDYEVNFLLVYIAQNRHRAFSSTDSKIDLIFKKERSNVGIRAGSRKNESGLKVKKSNTAVLIAMVPSMKQVELSIIAQSIHLPSVDAGTR